MGCAVIDGPVSAPDLDERRVATYRAVDAPAACDRKRGGRLTHASACIRMILSIEPRAQVHAVQVFREDGSDAPAANVLRGLEVASEMPVSVICLPSTIARTRLKSRFREVCRCMAENGVLIIAAWAEDTPQAVPASFRTVTGVASTLHLPQSPRPFARLQLPRAIGLPMSASRGTAFVSGLACAYITDAGTADGESFRRSIVEFGRRYAEADEMNIFAAGSGPGREGWYTVVGEAYRRYLRNATGARRG